MTSSSSMGGFSMERRLLGEGFGSVLGARFRLTTSLYLSLAILPRRRSNAYTTAKSLSNCSTDTNSFDVSSCAGSWYCLTNASSSGREHNGSCCLERLTSTSATSSMRSTFSKKSRTMASRSRSDSPLRRSDVTEQLNTVHFSKVTFECSDCA